MMESRNMDSNGVIMSSSLSSKLLNGLEQTVKNSVFSGDESTTNGFMNQNGDDRSDSFILDIDMSFDRDMITPNSRFTLQKSLSRKGSQRGFEKKTNEKDTTTCSPRGQVWEQ